MNAILKSIVKKDEVSAKAYTIHVEVDGIEKRYDITVNDSEDGCFPDSNFWGEFMKGRYKVGLAILEVLARHHLGEKLSLPQRFSSETSHDV